MQITRTYYLELNSIPFATPAWEIPDLSAFLDDPALRGSDDIIPGIAGSIAHARRITTTVVTLPLDVLGTHDWNGGAIPEADQFEQLLIHMDYLKANLGLASSTGDGTVQAIYHRGDLEPLYADVHFLGFKGTSTQGKRLLRTTFDLSIPAGRFEPAGS